MGQMDESTQTEQIVEVETLPDEQLEKMVNEPSSDPAPQAAQEAAPAPEGEQQEQEAEPPTVEELQSQLEAANTKLNQVTGERDHWQKVRTEHEQNANAIRAAKEELQKRIDANKEQDPAQLFIDNPNGMADAITERAKMEMQMDQIGQREQEMQQRNAIAQNAYQIDTACPDLKDNMDGIVSMMQKEGSTHPSYIQAFRENPAQFPAESVHRLNMMYRQEKQIADQQAQLEAYKSRGSEQLQKVEQAAQHQPMTNAATGASSSGDGGFPENMSPSEISKLSDADLDAILSAGQ